MPVDRAATSTPLLAVAAAQSCPFAPTATSCSSSRVWATIVTSAACPTPLVAIAVLLAATMYVCACRVVDTKHSFCNPRARAMVVWFPPPGRVRPLRQQSAGHDGS